MFCVCSFWQTLQQDHVAPRLQRRRATGIDRSTRRYDRPWCLAINSPLSHSLRGAGAAQPQINFSLAGAVKLGGGIGHAAHIFAERLVQVDFAFVDRSWCAPASDSSLVLPGYFAAKSTVFSGG